MNFYSTFYGKSAHVLIWLIMNPVTLALLNKSFLINKIRLTVFKARLFLNNYLQYLMEITFAAWKISLKWQASLSKTYRILLLWKWCGKMDAGTYFFFFFFVLSFDFQQLSLNKRIPLCNASEGKVFTSKLKPHKG